MVKRKNKKGGAVFFNYNNSASTVDPNIEMFRKINAWDCCKDAKNTTISVNESKNNDFNNMLQILFGNTPNRGSNWLSRWEIELNTIFRYYMNYGNLNEQEIVFERNGISVEKLPQKYFFNECGISGKKVSIVSDAIEFNTGGQYVDRGPGSGDINYKYPENGNTVKINEDELQRIGFPKFIKSWSCTGVDVESKDESPYSYSVELLDENGLTVVIESPSELLVSNPEKNTLINNYGNTSENIKKILFKELGDTMQTMIYKNFFETQKLDENLRYDALMLTCDKTVHYRNIMLGLPSCYTTTKKEDKNMPNTKIGRLFLPETDPKDKLLSLLNMEYEITLKNNIGIKLLLLKIIEQKVYFYFTLRTSTKRQEKVSLSQYNETVLNSIQKEIIENFDDINNQLEIEKNNFFKNIEKTTYHNIQQKLKQFYIPPLLTRILVDDYRGVCININLFNLNNIQNPLLKLIKSIKQNLMTDALIKLLPRGGVGKRGRTANNNFNNPKRTKSNLSLESFFRSMIGLDETENLTGNEKYLIDKIYTDIIPKQQIIYETEKYNLTYIYYCVCIYYLHINRNKYLHKYKLKKYPPSLKHRYKYKYIEDEEVMANIRLNHSIYNMDKSLNPLEIIYKNPRALPRPKNIFSPMYSQQLLERKTSPLYYKQSNIGWGGKLKRNKKRKIIRKTKRSKNKFRKTYKRKK